MAALWSSIWEWDGVGWEGVLESFRQEYRVLNWQWEQRGADDFAVVVEVDSKGFGLCVALGSEGGKEVKVGPRGS